MQSTAVNTASSQWYGGDGKNAHIAYTKDGLHDFACNLPISILYAISTDVYNEIEHSDCQAWNWTSQTVDSVNETSATLNLPFSSVLGLPLSA